MRIVLAGCVRTAVKKPPAISRQRFVSPQRKRSRAASPQQAWRVRQQSRRGAGGGDSYEIVAVPRPLRSTRAFQCVRHNALHAIFRLGGNHDASQFGLRASGKSRRVARVTYCSIAKFRCRCWLCCAAAISSCCPKCPVYSKPYRGEP
jgi:hypothetical protein